MTGKCALFCIKKGIVGKSIDPICLYFYKLQQIDSPETDFILQEKTCIFVLIFRIFKTREEAEPGRRRGADFWYKKDAGGGCESLQIPNEFSSGVVIA